MDTRNKRAAALGIALSFRLVLPLADGAVETNDRAHTAYSYFGLDVVDVIVSDILLTGSYMPSLTLTGSTVASMTATASYVPSALLTGSSVAGATLTGSNVPSFTLTGSVEDLD